MAWAKLDDGMPTHPKVMAAGPLAFALDVAAICYSNKHLTDGHIAEHVLPAVLPGMNKPKRHADRLVEVGRWSEIEGGWVIHDFHDFQPTAAHQREVSRKRAEAGSKGGSKSTSKRRASGKQNASTVSKPVPARPVPTPEEQDLSPSDDGQAEADRQFEDHFWPAYPPTNGRKPEKGKALAQWRKLTVEQRRRALIGARNLAASDVTPKYAHRFLRKDTAGEFPFDDFQREPAATPARGPAPPAARDANFLEGFYPDDDPRAQERTA